MIRICRLNEAMFGGHPCHIEFSDEKTKNEYLNSRNPAIKRAAEWLAGLEGKVLKDGFIPGLSNSEFDKFTRGGARIVLLVDHERHTLKVMEIKKRNERTYKQANAKKGYKSVIRKIDTHLKQKEEDQLKHEVQEEQVKKSNTQSANRNKFDVASVTPIDNYCLVVSFVEDDDHRKPDDVIFDLNPLIGSNAYLKNKDVFKTAKLDGDYVKWDSGIRISLHDIFAKCETVAEEDLLTERWRRRRGRYLLYR